MRCIYIFGRSDAFLRKLIDLNLAYCLIKLDVQKVGECFTSVMSATAKVRCAESQQYIFTVLNRGGETYFARFQIFLRKLIDLNFTYRLIKLGVQKIGECFTYVISVTY